MTADVAVGRLSPLQAIVPYTFQIRRIKDAHIKDDDAVREIHGQRFQASLEKRSTVVIIGQPIP